MKKFISTVAAFGLVLGAAASASALDLTVKGKYMLEGYYFNQGDGTGVTATDTDGADAAYVHTFLMKPTLKVNDKISMKADIRFLKDSDMGDNDQQMELKNNRNVDIHKIYMEWMSPVGKTRFGRTPGGAWAHDFLSSSGNADRLMWWPSFVQKPFSLVVFTQKSVENDWKADTSDCDSDMYKASLSYKADNMKLMAAYSYTNDKTNATYDHQASRAEIYGDLNFDNVYVEFESAYIFGDAKDYDDSSMDDLDVDAWGAMIDVGMKTGDLDVGVMYYYASGDDDSGDDDLESLMTITKGAGDDFNPYYILNGDHTGVLNSDEYSEDSDMASAGVHCIGIHADYKVSDQLTLHGAVAYAEADEAPDNVDDEYGWEVDLGAKYKLLDNLTYDVRAAYADMGDFFEDMNKGDDDIYVLSHHLTMTF